MYLVINICSPHDQSAGNFKPFLTTIGRNIVKCVNYTYLWKKSFRIGLKNVFMEKKFPNRLKNSNYQSPGHATIRRATLSRFEHLFVPIKMYDM
jgi:hypothetical protein